MAKTEKAPSALTLSKSGEKGREKIVFTLTSQNVIKALMCFAMEFSGVFASMSPFGIAFYASVFRQDAWVMNFVSAMLGIMLSGKSYFWTYAIVLTFVTVIFAISDKVSKNIALRSVVCGSVFALLGAVRYMRTAFSGFDIIALVFEAVLMGIGVTVFFYGFDILLNFKKRSFVSEKENICAYSTLAVAVLSLRVLPLFAGMNVANIVSMVIIFILCIGSSPKAALTPAILLGVISAVGTSGKSGVMGTFAFGALLAGSLRRYGKIGVVLGFITANTASSLFLTDAEQIVLSIYDSFVASVIFMFVPGSVIRYFSELSAKTENAMCSQKTASASRVSADRLRRMSESLKKLSAIYEDAAKIRGQNFEYIKNAAGLVKDKICTHCPSKESCYSSQNGYIYESIKNYIASPSLKICPSTLDDRLKTLCHRKDGVCSELRGIVCNLKNESRWMIKLNESRKLISEQLMGISEAVCSEGNKICVSPNRELEEKLWIEFDKSELFPVSLSAYTPEDIGFEIRVSFKECDVHKSLVSKCRLCVEKATNIKAEFGGIRKGKGTVGISFYQGGGYSASFGNATKSKNGESVSGDSFNVIYTNRNRMIMALSDGMGSGEDASKESSLVISMLDSFLYAGIECDTAIRLINSSLLLKGSKESFATIDLCDVNLTDLSLTFTKLGAASAYIKSGDKVKKITGKSLPAGILTEAKAEKHMLPIDSECVVILVSDGIADIALKNENCSDWLEKELLGISNSNPQIIAGKILETAYLLDGKNASDDMTVIAACIEKR